MKNLLLLLTLVLGTLSYGQCAGVPVPQVEITHQDCPDTWQDPGVDVGEITVQNSAAYASVYCEDSGNIVVPMTNMSAGTYTVYCVVGTCIQTEVITIVEIPNQGMPIFATNNPICYGDSTVLYTTWAVDSIEFRDNQSNVQNGNLVPAGSYYAVAWTTGCATTATPNVIVEEFPRPVLFAGDTTLCDGGFTSLGISPTQTVIFYDNTGTAIDESLVSAGDYYASGITLDGCDFVTDTIHIDDCLATIEREYDLITVDIIYYNLVGQRVQPQMGDLVLKTSVYDDGSEYTQKIIFKK